jgi:hypothetical protein
MFLVCPFSALEGGPVRPYRKAHALRDRKYLRRASGGQCRQRPCGECPRGLLFAKNLRLVSGGKSTPCSFFENKTESILVKN